MISSKDDLITIIRNRVAQFCHTTGQAPNYLMLSDDYIEMTRRQMLHDPYTVKDLTHGLKKGTMVIDGMVCLPCSLPNIIIPALCSSHHTQS